MANAPMVIKIILIILMCGACSTLLVGFIGRDPMAFKLAGTFAVLATILVIGWRVSQKSGGSRG